LWDILFSGCDVERFVAFEKDEDPLYNTFDYSSINKDLERYYKDRTRPNAETVPLEDKLMWDREELYRWTVKTDKEIGAWSLSDGLNFRRLDIDNTDDDPGKDEDEKDGGVVFDALSDTTTLCYNEELPERLHGTNNRDEQKFRFVVRFRPAPEQDPYPKASLDDSNYISGDSIVGEKDYRTFSFDFRAMEINSDSRIRFQPGMAGHEVTVRHIRVERVNKTLDDSLRRCIELAVEDETKDGTAWRGDTEEVESFRRFRKHKHRDLTRTTDIYYKRDLRRLRRTPLAELDRDVVRMVEMNARIRAGRGGFEGLLKEIDGDPETLPMRFLRGSLFHRRIERLGDTSNSTRAMGDTSFDLHRRISLVRNHLTLLPPLGLVIEAWIPSSALPKATDTGKLYVEPIWSKRPTPDYIPPRTAFEIRRENGLIHTFRAEIKVPWIDDGALAICDHDHFSLSMLNVDAAMLKMVDYAATKQQARADDAPDSSFKPADDEDEPPAPESAGITLSQIGRLNALRERHVRGRKVQRSAEGHNQDDDPLYFHELIQGYVPVVEVKKTTDRHAFRTNLAERGERYELTRSDGTKYIWPNPEEEPKSGYGAIRTASAQAHDAVPVEDGDEPEYKDENISQTLFRWDGWSLAVDRPDAELRRLKTQYGEVPDPTGRGELPWTLNTTYTLADGSQVPIRYGFTYTFSCLIQDVAGNLHGAESCAKRVIRYVRFDAIKVPPLLLEKPVRRMRGPGEAPDTMVVWEPYQSS
ncbi:MAG: hypothetical protein V2A73_06765, partial [Pseudomonadota bacterium]